MNGSARLASWVFVAALLVVGCSPALQETSPVSPLRTGDDAKQVATRAPEKTGSARIDPRAGGVNIVLGEWAITPEAPAIRPGKITFVIHNRGTMDHGIEIELEGESSGHGSGDLFKAESELLSPGESTRMTMTLGPGVYKIECLVDGHDDMGMEDLLDVRAGAPFVKVRAAKPASDRIAIADFAFAPQDVSVPAGTKLTWTNDDPTPHTVTALEGEFGSDTLDPGDSFSFHFDRPGTYSYRCAIHPEMKGVVTVR